MNKRILFCVETTPEANTDYAYITETISRYYQQSSKIVRRPIYMRSKSRYNSKAVQEEIRRQSGPNTSVIYCIDTDDFDTSAETERQLKQIQQYCTDKGYDFVFFCRDIEDVYYGERIPDTRKIQAVRKFRTAHAIEKVRTELLERMDLQPHCSNILIILDRYMTRKS